MIYIDTNILIYLQNKNSPYHISSKYHFDYYLKNNQICINQLVLSEFFSVITDSRKITKPWEIDKAVKYINTLSSWIYSVHQINDDIFIEVLSTLSLYNIKRYQIYDHLIACSMKYYGIKKILTANKKDFEKYDFIEEIIVPEKDCDKPQAEQKEFISYGKQWINDVDIKNVVETLKSDYLTQGPAIAAFENAICNYTGAKYCVALSNGTAALHIAAAALNIDKDSEGITSPNTFAASSNCMLYNNIKPVFADINSKTYNIEADTIKEKISDKTKLFIPVHFAGRPCNMLLIKELADKHKTAVIEDAAHAIGSNYRDGFKVGNCKYSDMTIFSFHPVKTITTGEGGAVTTNSKDLYEKLLLLRTHGITKDQQKLTQNPGPWYYEMQELGYNYRMTDIQAALGLSQLLKIEQFKERRNKIIKKYNTAFAELSNIETPFDEGDDFCYHLYVVKINFNNIGINRSDFMNKLREKNIGTQVLYIPVYKQPYYKKIFDYKDQDCPNTEDYYEQTLALPLYPKMSDEQVEYVIKNVKELVC